MITEDAGHFTPIEQPQILVQAL